VRPHEAQPLLPEPGHARLRLLLLLPRALRLLQPCLTALQERLL
jgi:hypothetical protein